tara:strand:- start:122 stop:280 length:159 start_codon:yes stop_codon:yes gene_type:complete
MAEMAVDMSLPSPLFDLFPLTRELAREAANCRVLMELLMSPPEAWQRFLRAV